MPLKVSCLTGLAARVFILNVIVLSTKKGPPYGSPFLGNVLVVLGAGDFSTLDWSHIILDKLIPITMTGKVIYIAFVAVLYAAILWMNKKRLLKSYPKKLIHSSYTKQYLFLKNSICLAYFKKN